MEYHGYHYDMKNKDDIRKVLNRMHSHSRNWRKTVKEWAPSLDLKLYINDELWEKGKIWTETDTLFCDGLSEVGDFLKKTLN